MKKFIKKLHLYFALILCFPLVLQGLSGAILVFGHEISKEGTSFKEGFFAVIKKFHTNILIDGDIGRNIVGIWGLTMLFMIITGIILWWPKKDRPYTFTFKFRSEGKKFHRDIHAAIGFWTLVFFTISSFSGVYLAFPKATSKVILSIFSGQNLSSSVSEIKVNPTENFIGIDEAIELAKTAVTDEEKFISAKLPIKPDQPFIINFAPKNYREGEPTITIFIDQYQKKIIEKRDPALYSTGEKIIAWQHAIHTGEAFNIIWKIIIFSVGFLPLLFSITGIMMWAYKKKFVQQPFSS